MIDSLCVYLWVCVCLCFEKKSAKSFCSCWESISKNTHTPYPSLSQFPFGRRCSLFLFYSNLSFTIYPPTPSPLTPSLSVFSNPYEIPFYLATIRVTEAEHQPANSLCLHKCVAECGEDTFVMEQPARERWRETHKRWLFLVMSHLLTPPLGLALSSSISSSYKSAVLWSKAQSGAC